MNKISKLFLLLICFAFVISYIIYETGYYEYKLQNRMILTKEQMEEFENDVNEGKYVDLNDYLVETEKDYTSSFTKGTMRVSLVVNKYLKRGIEFVFKRVNRLVED